MGECFWMNKESLNRGVGGKAGLIEIEKKMGHSKRGCGRGF